MHSIEENGLTQSQLRAVGAGNFFRARDLEALGGGFRDLQRYLEEGSVVQVARGLYWLADADPSPFYSLAAVAARVPHGILCLLSALTVHAIGTQLPADVWIGIAHKARAPRLPEFPTRIVRFSGPSLRYGVTKIEIEGAPALITSPARTVVDCFRFRRLVGLDVAQEALREALRERKATVAEIWRAAEVCRARSLVGPMLEALGA
jgi:predicted transcriptional regulator of viral defense system